MWSRIDIESTTAPSSSETRRGTISSWFVAYWYSWDQNSKYATLPSRSNSLTRVRSSDGESVCSPQIAQPANVSSKDDGIKEPVRAPLLELPEEAVSSANIISSNSRLTAAITNAAFCCVSGADDEGGKDGVTAVVVVLLPLLVLLPATVPPLGIEIFISLLFICVPRRGWVDEEPTIQSSYWYRMVSNTNSVSNNLSFGFESLVIDGKLNKAVSISFNSGEWPGNNARTHSKAR